MNINDVKDNNEEQKVELSAESVYILNLEKRLIQYDDLNTYLQQKNKDQEQQIVYIKNQHDQQLNEANQEIQNLKVQIEQYQIKNQKEQKKKQELEKELGKVISVQLKIQKETKQIKEKYLKNSNNLLLKETEIKQLEENLEQSNIEKNEYYQQMLDLKQDNQIYIKQLEFNQSIEESELTNQEVNCLIKNHTQNIFEILKEPKVNNEMLNQQLQNYQKLQKQVLNLRQQINQQQQLIQKNEKIQSDYEELKNKYEFQKQTCKVLAQMKQSFNYTSQAQTVLGSAFNQSFTSNIEESQQIAKEIFQNVQDK